jgi:hypothetical protein
VLPRIINFINPMGSKLPTLPADQEVFWVFEGSDRSWMFDFAKLNV